jgi:hypothetical protein
MKYTNHSTNKTNKTSVSNLNMNRMINKVSRSNTGSYRDVYHHDEMSFKAK